MRVIALMYHDIVDERYPDQSGFPGAKAASYKLGVEQFKAHVRRVASVARRRSLGVGNIPAEGLRSDALAITFDDGGCSAFSTVAPLLEDLGWHGHFFVPTDYIGRPSFLDARQIRELRQRGHIIGTHSCSHPIPMSSCPWERLVEEWSRSRAVLSDIVSEEVTVGSIPGGHYREEIARAGAASGVKVLFTSEPTTRLRTIDGCLIVGRFGVTRGTAARTVARLASGGIISRLGQYVRWNGRKLVKTTLWRLRGTTGAALA